VIPVRLVLADDHEIIRMGLRTLLQTRSDWSVVGEAVNGEEAVDMVLSLQPDVALLDIAMPKLNGIEATRQILTQGARTKILLLSAHDSSALESDVFYSQGGGPVAFAAHETRQRSQRPYEKRLTTGATAVNTH
jgi:DNA-binding NarL/FixJ family response regulator